jgi:hypothetical protein
MLDSKEQILEFELTAHGKRQLSLGILSPTYYSFSDNDLIYDLEYAGILEEQSEIQNRFLESTPIFNPIVFHSSVEDSIRKIKESASDENIDIFVDFKQEQVDRDYLQIQSLGNSELGNPFLPSWEVKLYSGGIVASSIEVSGTANVKIPTLELDTQKYQISVIENLPEPTYRQIQLEGIEPGIVGNFQRFKDGTFMEVIPEDIFIELNEINSILGDSNFELEIYLYTGRLQRTLKPLYFSDPQPVSNHIYNEEDYYQTFTNTSSPDSVEQYFSIEVDEEISDNIICKYVPIDRRQGIYGNLLECPAPRRFTLND